MSKEEKEAIKFLISRCNECEFATCENCEINWKQVQAIDKLQKENEELKENSISKDIIRDKIKGLNKNIDLQWASTNYNEIEVYKYQYSIEVLKELLGE